ncbi:MAG TPA: L-threonylcarbamoyladenylate synthase [Sphingomonadales bacterium]|nr:L-threonylcarbamoyladenylate synthase [Sphingomonadales bacterium]
MPAVLGIAPNVRRASAGTIADAARRIAKGGLVAIPTETVYGLAANALDERALARVFAVKGRPEFNPLIIHVLDAAEAKKFAVFTSAAERLTEVFWPGPLTLVLARRPDCPIPLLANAGLPSIALRAPAHPVAKAVLKAASVPVAAPSANSSGALSPTTAQHVAADLGGKIDLILDGGPCPIGLESTVVDARKSPARILRPGAVTQKQLEAVLGEPVAGGKGSKIESPGQLDRHYAPRTRLRLNARARKPGEVRIGFGAIGGDFNLSARGDLTEAAANFFAMLRLADAKGAKAISIAPIPNKGLGAAINDRLRRAAKG